MTVGRTAGMLASAIAAADAACNALVCNNAELLDYAMANLEPAPAAALAAAIAVARGEVPPALAAASEAAAPEPALVAPPISPDAEAPHDAPTPPSEPAPSDRTVDEMVRGYQLEERSRASATVPNERARLTLGIAFLAIALAVLTGWTGRGPIP